MSKAERWDQRADEATFHPWRTALKWTVGTILIVLAALALISAAFTGSVFFGAFAAKHTVNARTDIKVFTPDNKIAQIAFFHNTCNQVGALANTLKGEQENLLTLEANAHSSDPIRQQQAADSLAQVSTQVTGTYGALQQAAADYNSRSAQSIASVFKDGNLPPAINVPSSIQQTLTWSPPSCG